MKIANTKASLRGQLGQTGSQLSYALGKLGDECAKVQRLEKRNEELAAQFGDLKIRLHDAEMANQRMRGYLERVYEDDVVREELVVTGDPNGHQALAPKRKPPQFPRPNDFKQAGPVRDEWGRHSFDTDKQKPKHWITY